MVLNSNFDDNIVFVSHENSIDFANLSKLEVTWSGGSAHENYQGIGIYSQNAPGDIANALASRSQPFSRQNTISSKRE